MSGSEANQEWWPCISEYDPGITAQEYHDLFLDESLVRKEGLQALYDLYQMPDHQGTCSEMGQRYGHHSGHYLGCLVAVAAAIVRKTGCEVVRDITDGKKKLWPVLFIGRDVGDRARGGVFSWKMREPVAGAIRMLIEEGKLPVGSPVTPKLSERIQPDFPRNLILYGPPGTGKTYHSVNYAVAICEGKDPETVMKEPYQKVFDRFRKLREAGRIDFMTFHQSCGYEEFIEGIRPVPDTEGGLMYRLENGIFKNFCERAGQVRIGQSGKTPIKKNPRIWGMLLGGTGMTELKRECFARNEIRLGWYEFHDAPDGEFTGTAELSASARCMLTDFRSVMDIGDIVIIAKNSRSVDAVGVISGDYEYDASSGDYPRRRAVEWLVRDIDQDMGEFLPEGRLQMPRKSLFSLDVVGTQGVSGILRRHGGAAVTDIRQEEAPFVFIIDEINRGNISRIFGELITLIEDSRRAGAEEALEATLPYSGSRFSVPSNVFILGTMNTADRSIALLDTALRRRFDFREMRANPEVLRNLSADRITVSGTEISVARILEVINERIECLYDREHTIGHAFFVPLRESPTLETLARIFKNRVIPLLQEYFHEDYSKIQLVLGDNAKDSRYRFIDDEELRVKSVFSGVPDIDLPSRKYRIQDSAFTEIMSYKLIGSGI